LIEHLSSKHKLLSSNPVPQKKKEEEEKGRKEGRKEIMPGSREVIFSFIFFVLGSLQAPLGLCCTGCYL
jgi:hypothetical protein